MSLRLRERYYGPSSAGRAGSPGKDPNHTIRAVGGIIGKARGRLLEHRAPKDWTPVLDVHPTDILPDPLSGYVWLQFPERIRLVRRRFLEFWYDPPGCALTDEELSLLRRVAEADEPVMFRALSRTVPAHRAFDHQVDALKDLWRAGWLTLETWRVEDGDRGHARRRYNAAQAHSTESGREALELISG